MIFTNINLSQPKTFWLLKQFLSTIIEVKQSYTRYYRIKGNLWEL